MTREESHRTPAWIRLGAVGATLAVAFVLKLHFSEAAPEALRWILAPTVRVVSALTGVGFEAAEGVGYIAHNEPFAVTKSCAGVNFLIVAFSMLALAGVWKATSPWAPVRAMLGAGAIAYVATVVANALRIAIAMALAHLEGVSPVLSGDGAHRIVGVVVYFLGLCLLYAVFVLRPGASARDRRPRPVGWLIPLAFYLGITLGVPLLNGWVRGRPMAWSEHTLVLLLLPAGLLAFVLLGARFLRSARSRRRRLS